MHKLLTRKDVGTERLGRARVDRGRRAMDTSGGDEQLSVWSEGQPAEEGGYVGVSVQVDADLLGRHHGTLAVLRDAEVCAGEDFGGIGCGGGGVA